MAKKKSTGHRGHGEGSITERKDGRFQVSITLEDGKRKYYYAKDRRGAQAILKTVQYEQQKGTLVTGPQQSLEQFLGEWLKSHKQAIRPRSYERYETIVRLHIIPTLGKTQLSKLTAQHVDKLLREKLEAGLAPKTVSFIHGVLHTALDKAVEWGFIGKNVCDIVSPPRLVRKEIQPLTPDQVRSFLEAAKGHPLEALFVLALSTGMRRGELLGLKWQDIDFGRGILQVNRAMVRTLAGLGGYKEAETKTTRSRRSIVLTAFAIEILKKHQEQQTEMKIRVADLWQDHDYVFCKPTGEYLHPDNDVFYQLKKLLKDTGLPNIRFHDLRHSTATMLLSKGVHPRIVQEILGHSEISMTMNTYSHVLPTMQKEAMDKLDDLFNS